MELVFLVFFNFINVNNKDEIILKDVGGNFMFIFFLILLVIN